MDKNSTLSADKGVNTAKIPTSAQIKYLKSGLGQAGGKLSIFDENGQQIPKQTIKACIANGWAEPWFNNPLKPDWLVCKLTELGKITLK